MIKNKEIENPIRAIGFGLIALLIIILGWLSFNDGPIRISILHTINRQYQSSSLDADSPKKVIIVMGDGVGIGQITGHTVQNKNFSHFEKFKNVGLLKNFPSVVQGSVIGYSGSAATAMATGEKTLNGNVGVDADKEAVKNIMEIAKEKGLAIGSVTTASVTDATPAGFFAHESSRSNHERIARDFLDTEPEVLIGGGRTYFQFQGNGDNIIPEFEAAGYTYAQSLKDLARASKSGDKLLGLFSEKALPQKKLRGNFTLEATKSALRVLEKNEKGFLALLEVEGTDTSAHINDEKLLLEEMAEFDELVGYIYERYNEDPTALILIVSDHETGGVHVTEGSLETGDVELVFSTKDHTADLVPIFSHGPSSENYTGILDNTEIFKNVYRFLTE